MKKCQLQLRISIMMFFQFFTWGAWFVTLAQVLITHGAVSIIGGAYGTAPIAAMVTPLFLGLVADRFFASEKIMGVLMLIGGLCMIAVPFVLQNEQYDIVYWLFLAHMCCYMPTLGLGNAIAFTHIKGVNFPKVRVWGTIGWVVAGLLAGAMGWSDSINLFWMAGISALLLGIYCFTLPNTPAPLAGIKIDVRSLLMLDALKLLAKPSYLVLIICSTLVCIPLAYYYSYTSVYLGNVGFTQPASTMTLGQISEIFFMLLIPLCFRKLGVKNMILIGMGAWVLRYLLFAYGVEDQIIWMILLGIVLHGICYDFFFVTGFMYTDKIASKSIRGQAQSMLIFFTQGVGMFVGFKIAASKFAPVAEVSTKLTQEITIARGEESLTFVQKLINMFSVNMPESLNPQVLVASVSLWKNYWIFPAFMALIVAIVFFLGFWDKNTEEESLGIEKK